MRAALLPLSLLILLSAVFFGLRPKSQAVEPSKRTEPAATESRTTAPATGKIANFTARDYRGKETSLDEVAKGKQAVVVAFIGTECPLAKLYAPRLTELAAQFADKDVAFIAVDSNRQDSITEIAHYARTHEVSFPILKDVGNVIADRFGAQRTPEVFLLDKDRTIRYSGRVDDQYGLGNTTGYAQTKVKKRHLAIAIEELLAGKKISEPRTEAPGCLIGRTHQPKPDSKITYSNQVARILQDNCVECHREGQIAPFAMTNYEEVAGWSEMIEEVVRDQRMPPWHANPKIGKFSNDRSMSDADKETLYAWVKAGSPQGNPADLPKPRTYPESWEIGQPDEIYYMDDKAFDIPAEGTVEYQYFMIDPGWKEDRWIRASECLLDNRAIVHHVFVFAVSPENPLAKLNGPLGHGVQPSIGDGSVRLIGGAAPGTPPAQGPKGSATLVKAGTKLLFQMHYTPIGTPQKDRTCIGFQFAKPEEVTRAVEVRMAINPSFNIPAHADNHPVESQYKFARDTLLLSLTPHMHLRGKDFRYDLRYPDGTVETILDVPHYDFNWQVIYRLAEPKFVPAGTQLYCLAHFDNSVHNLANPNADAPVTWGEQTWEEMMIGWFDETTDVYPSDLHGAPSRTARFLADSQKNPPKVGKFIVRASESALKSDTGVERLLDRLVRELPQVDRVCVSIVDGDQVRFLQAAQASVLDAPLGRTERTYPAGQSALARFLKSGQPVMNADLSAVEGADAEAMSQVIGSSFHVPITVGDQAALVSYWSKEKNAFPELAVELLRQVSKLIDESN